VLGLWLGIDIFEGQPNFVHKLALGVITTSCGQELAWPNLVSVQWLSSLTKKPPARELSFNLIKGDLANLDKLYSPE